jgi:hypothetical protein
MPKFNYEKAKEAGYSEQEISSFLSKEHPGFNLEKAKKSGHSDEEINKYLSSYKQPKKQEPATLKGSAQQYGTGLAGGAGGIVGDVNNLLNNIPGYGTIFGPRTPRANIPGTHELSDKISKEFDVGDPVNSLERILRESGQWGGQEATLGLGLGGPTASLSGILHGSASGALYGGLKELGVDDDWALGITMLATVSPIALRRLWPKIEAKLASRANVAQKTAETQLKPPIEPPPPPPGIPPTEPLPAAFPFAGEELPPGRKGFGLAEEALEELQKPTIEKTGKTSEINLPKETAEVKPLTGRAKVIENEVGSVVSPEKFSNERHGGENISGLIKKEFEDANKVVRKKYKRAEKTYKGQNDIVPALAKSTEDMLESLSRTAEPSTAEKAVIAQLKSLQKIIGTSMEPIEVGLDRLIKTADSMSQLVKYEVPSGGVKNILKTFIKDLNEAVIDSLKRKKINSKPIREADKAYSEMAERFFNDEVKGFMERTIRNPEALYRSAVRDEGTYRAVRDALGSKNSSSKARLERDIVSQSMRPYVKDITKVGSKEFNDSISHLEGLIGERDSNLVRKYMEREKNTRPSELKLKEAKKISPHRITEASYQERPPNLLVRLLRK